MLIWEEVHRIRQEVLLLEVEHVKAHRSKNEVQEVTLFEHFVTDGNEGADEMAKVEAMLDGGDMEQIRASTVQAENRGGLCGLAVCGWLSVFSGGVEVL